ncbi:uncharacterized protein [Paramormyrops kingsleyae]|uniref:uncharacterized protein isoform X2 n=1 Tax=Paramormyrops kingsleyae TaxID=1676925 RepID=UPI003B97C2CD
MPKGGKSTGTVSVDKRRCGKQKTEEEGKSVNRVRTGTGLRDEEGETRRARGRERDGAGDGQMGISQNRGKGNKKKMSRLIQPTLDKFLSNLPIISYCPSAASKEQNRYAEELEWAPRGRTSGSDPGANGPVNSLQASLLQDSNCSLSFSVLPSPCVAEGLQDSSSEGGPGSQTAANITETAAAREWRERETETER